MNQTIFQPILLKTQTDFLSILASFILHISLARLFGEIFINELVENMICNMPYSVSLPPGSDIHAYFAVLNRARKVKSRTPAQAHTKTKIVCTHLQAVPASLRYCQERNKVWSQITHLKSPGMKISFCLKKVTLQRKKIDLPFIVQGLVGIGPILDIVVVVTTV